jgi:hypothetical protein
LRNGDRFDADRVGYIAHVSLSVGQTTASQDRFETLFGQRFGQRDDLHGGAVDIQARNKYQYLNGLLHDRNGMVRSPVVTTIQSELVPTLMVDTAQLIG